MEVESENNKSLELTSKEERFCYQYVLHLNATKACILAGYSEKTAYAAGSRLLRNVKIQERIQYLKENLAETAEISSLRVLKEHEKIAFVDAGQLRDGWLSLKDFEDLTDEQKSVIQEITTRQTKYGDEVKIKLYDKQKSLDSINRMCGFDAPTKTEITGKDGKDFAPFKVEVIDKQTKNNLESLINKLSENDKSI